MSEPFTVLSPVDSYRDASETAIERLHVLIETAKKLQLDRFTITLDLAIQLEALAGIGYEEIYGDKK